MIVFIWIYLNTGGRGEVCFIKDNSLVRCATASVLACGLLEKFTIGISCQSSRLPERGPQARTLAAARGSEKVELLKKVV